MNIYYVYIPVIWTGKLCKPNVKLVFFLKFCNHPANIEKSSSSDVISLSKNNTERYNMRRKGYHFCRSMRVILPWSLLTEFPKQRNDNGGSWSGLVDFRSVYLYTWRCSARRTTGRIWYITGRKVFRLSFLSCLIILVFGKTYIMHNQNKMYF